MSKENLSSQDSVRVLLREYLDAAQIKNPNYSIRSLAKKLKVSPATLSEVLRSKRRVTAKLCSRVCEGLVVAPDIKKELLRGLKNKKQQDSNATSEESPASDNYVDLNMDQYHLVGDWYYSAILCLATTDDFKGDVDWVARRLNLNKKTTQESLNRLERLGLLDKNKNGDLVATGKMFSTSTDVASYSLRKHHSQNLDMARSSLEQDEINERDFSFIYMAVDPKDMPEMKKEIKNFRRKFCERFEQDKKQEVYRMSIQLFSLSKRRTYNEG